MYNPFEHRPQVGDKFYDRSRFRDHQNAKLQPNGFIVDVDYNEKEVTVEFYDDGEQEIYTWDEIEDDWEDDLFGGIYMHLPSMAVK